MKFNRTSLTIAGIAVLMAAVPAISFAQDKGNNQDNNNGNSSHSFLGWFRNEAGNAGHDIGNAWGHLIAPGWLKHNGNPGRGCDRDNDGDDRAENCGPVTSTTTPGHPGHPGNPGTPGNPSPLVLSGLTSSVLGQNQAQVSWTTNNSANSTIWYSTSSPVITSTASTVTAAGNVYNHYELLNSLAASTTYYYVVSSTDTHGNTATSSQASFTTSVGPVVNPLSISNAVAVVGSNSVTLNWTTSVGADSEAWYATTSPVTIGSSSATKASDGTLVTSHSLNVTGLATSTTYYMIIQSKDASNNTQATGQFSFTTGL